MLAKRGWPEGEHDSGLVRDRPTRCSSDSKTLIRLGLYVKYLRSYFVQERLQMSSGRSEDRPWWTGLARATPITFSLSRMLEFVSVAVITGVRDEKGSATPLR